MYLDEHWFFPENAVTLSGGSGKNNSKYWIGFWGLIIAALIGAAAAIFDPESEGGDDPVVQAPPVPSQSSAGNEPEAGGEETSAPVEIGGAESDDGTDGDLPDETVDAVHTGDGSSRGEPKLLMPDKPEEASINAGNDVDWYVYEVTEDQTATIELIKGKSPPDSESAGVAVSIWEENTLVEKTGAWPDEPLIFPHGATRGIPLYIEVIDECGSGCSRGAYSIEIRSAPPG
ncbi:MAG: hypothetical protein QOE75_714 [Solirubrobacterales bacterium]|nr:hypothetical protein [Solirubrobacterales bacterium]